MHTFTGPEGTTFNFNSDMSGEVRVLPARERPTSLKMSTRETWVPGADLIAFAQYLASDYPTTLGLASQP
jgi:hypothetical protein